ncbi:MAG: adenylate/guanylate cyclase domain-containing protein [Flavobacteriales bacterium]|nr:adenylate/guanylate cyclase domain-containing protein [Flavobacteriales bacterium]
MTVERISRTRVRFQRVLRITLAWAIMACLAAVFEHATLLSNGVHSQLADHIGERLPASLLAGLLGGGLYIFVLRDRWRKLPYFQAAGIMAVLLLAVVVLLFALLPAPGLAHLTPGGRLLSFQFAGTYLYWLLLMAGTMLMVRLNDQYGNGGISYLTGFYHKPRPEMRIFMFLDMRSSTAIAERLGHTRYFELLNELYADITDPILYSRGEIYQYVGDEISVSWSLRKGAGRQRCIRCFLDIRSKLEQRAAHYEARYGLAPVFKAGFHYGPVTTGEVGLAKKERIYSGDVVNTAAHIQSQCNAHGVDNLISQDLIDVLHLPESYTLREIGSTVLKGRRQEIRLWTLVRVKG